MSDVFYLRPMAPAVTAENVFGMVEQAGGCFDLHRVEWNKSFLATGGERMLCWYQAPDAEAARVALRQLEADMSAVWPGTVAQSAGIALDDVNVLAELAFEEPTEADGLAVAMANAVHDGPGVDHLVSITSNDRLKMICLFVAESKGSVESLLAMVGLTPEALWPCETLDPSISQ